MALAPEDLDALGKMMDERIKDVVGAAPAPADPPETAPTPLTKDDMAALLADAMKLATKGQDSQALQVMYNERLDEAKKLKGFEEFLADEDDAHGKPRSEVLDAMDVEDRMSALARMSKRFATALQSTPAGGDGDTTSQKMVETQTDFDAKYAELDAKWKAGEFASIVDFQNASMRIIADEQAAVAKLDG